LYIIRPLGIDRGSLESVSHPPNFLHCATILKLQKSLVGELVVVNIIVMSPPTVSRGSASYVVLSVFTVHKLLHAMWIPSVQSYQHRRVCLCQLSLLSLWGT